MYCIYVYLYILCLFDEENVLKILNKKSQKESDLVRFLIWEKSLKRFLNGIIRLCIQISGYDRNQKSVNCFEFNFKSSRQK